MVPSGRSVLRNESENKIDWTEMGPGEQTVRNVGKVGGIMLKPQSNKTPAHALHRGPWDGLPVRRSWLRPGTQDTAVAARAAASGGQ